MAPVNTAPAPKDTAIGQVFGDTAKSTDPRMHICWHDQNDSAKKWVHLAALLGREGTASLGAQRAPA